MTIKETIQQCVSTIEEIYEGYEPRLANSDIKPYTKGDLTLNLLTDLMHYCKANDISFMCQLNLAAEHFAKERARAAEKHKRIPPKKLAGRKNRI